MPAVSVRRVYIKDAWSNAAVVTCWQFLLDEVLPTMQRVSGVRSTLAYAGAGDLCFGCVLDDTGVSERFPVSYVERSPPCCPVYMLCMIV